MPIIAHTGLDVHDATIRVYASVDGSDDVLLDSTIINDESAVKKHFRKWSQKYDLRCCYEASSCGYVLQRWLNEINVSCVVVAPSLVPRRPGDRVKTDRRDAIKLARSLRNGDLTLVRIPTLSEEQDRRLVRYRGSVVRDIVRTKNQVLKHLGVLGRKNPYKSTWTAQYLLWLKGLELPEPDNFVLSEMLGTLEQQTKRLAQLDKRIIEMASSDLYRERVSQLMCFRGIGYVWAMTLVTEIIDFSRFKTARHFMSFLGIVPSEESSGKRRRQGAITKCGNTRCRHILVEAAGKYRCEPNVSPSLRKRQAGQDDKVIAHSWKAQQRLHKKYRGIAGRRNEKGVAIVAVARELAGFIWAVMTGNFTQVQKQPAKHAPVTPQGAKLSQAADVKKALELLRDTDPRLIALMKQRLSIPEDTASAA